MSYWLGYVVGFASGAVLVLLVVAHFWDRRRRG